MVVEQMKGPIEITGSFELSGRIATVGRSCPKEIAPFAEAVGLEEVAVEVEWVSDEACRATCLELPGEDEVDEVGAAADTRGERVLEEKDRVAVDAGIALEIELGMATGHKLHTCRP